MPLVRVGQAVKLIWLNVPEKVPRLGPLKLTRAPGLREPMPAKVSAAPWPEPGLTLTVELPAPRFRLCRASIEGAVPLPVKVSEPPLRLIGMVSAMRLVLLLALLSRTKAPPVLTVRPVPAE